MIKKHKYNKKLFLIKINLKYMIKNKKCLTEKKFEL